MNKRIISSIMLFWGALALCAAFLLQANIDMLKMARENDMRNCRGGWEAVIPNKVCDRFIEREESLQEDWNLAIGAAVLLLIPGGILWFYSCNQCSSRTESIARATDMEARGGASPQEEQHEHRS